MKKIIMKNINRIFSTPISKFHLGLCQLHISKRLIKLTFLAILVSYLETTCKSIVCDRDKTKLAPSLKTEVLEFDKIYEIKANSVQLSFGWPE